MTKERMPVCKKEGDEWVITMERATTVRVRDGGLAHRILDLATWAYHNGRDDRMTKIREALGVSDE